MTAPIDRSVRADTPQAARDHIVTMIKNLASTRAREAIMAERKHKKLKHQAQADDLYFIAKAVEALQFTTE